MRLLVFNGRIAFVTLHNKRVDYDILNFNSVLVTDPVLI